MDCLGTLDCSIAITFLKLCSSRFVTFHFMVCLHYQGQAFQEKFILGLLDPSSPESFKIWILSSTVTRISKL